MEKEEVKTERLIFKSIMAVMEEVGTISKNKKNTGQGGGFMYRGVDDVMNALQPALIKHGVFICPTVLSEERSERRTQNGGVLLYSRLMIRYDFFAVDGSSISAVVVGEAMDSGDKATNKAMSVAFKYACFQVFCIPTEEMKDPDSETHRITAEQNKVASLAVSRVCSMYGKKSIADMSKADCDDALKRLEQTKK